MQTGRTHTVVVISPTPKASATNPQARPKEAAKPIRRESLRLIGAPSRGPKDAPLVLVEFSDLAAPLHASLAATIAKFLAMVPDKVRHVFRHLPVKKSTDLHALAILAEQSGQFWSFYDYWLAHLGTPVLALADILKLPARNRELENRVLEHDLAEARRVHQTRPGVFLNGRRIEGNVTLEKLKSVADEERQAGWLRSLHTKFPSR